MRSICTIFIIGVLFSAQLVPRKLHRDPFRSVQIRRSRLIVGPIIDLRTTETQHVSTQHNARRRIGQFYQHASVNMAPQVFYFACEIKRMDSHFQHEYWMVVPFQYRAHPEIEDTSNNITSFVGKNNERRNYHGGRIGVIKRSHPTHFTK